MTALSGQKHEFPTTIPNTIIEISLNDYRVYLQNHLPLDRLYCRGDSCFFLVNRIEQQQVEASGTKILGKTIVTPKEPKDHDISSTQEDTNSTYHDSNETGLLLQGLETRFPSTAQKITIGYSVEGRELNVIKISDNVQSNENEPNIFIIGCHHAREWVSVEIPLLFAKYLLENYNTDPQVQRIVNGAQIFIMPIQNPDGLEFSINAYRLWNKNRRHNGDSSWGVDTNCNYNYMWGYDDKDSCQIPNNAEYRGAGPFSEPETQAVWQFLSENPPAGSISFQNYGQSILYPWGYTTDPAPDTARMKTISQEIAQHISRVNGRSYTTGSSGKLLYLTNGNLMDWIYGTFGTPVFTIEMPPEYMGYMGYMEDMEDIEDAPSKSEKIIASAFAENLPGLLYFTNYFIPNPTENENPFIAQKNNHLHKSTALDYRNNCLNVKTIDTDYYRVIVNSDGSLTFTNKNTGAIILDSSPIVYFNSGKISKEINRNQSFTSTGDKTTVTIIDSGNSFVSVTHSFRINTHSPYVDYTVTWSYKKECFTSEERVDFIVPGQEAEIMTRDLQFTPLNPTTTYWSDLYTPKVVKFANGLYFLGSDDMQSMRVQGVGGSSDQTQVSFYSDYSENHPHFHYVKNGGGAKIYSNETQRYVNDTSSASIQFAIDPGKSRCSLVKTRQPYAYDAALIFTSHPDNWSFEAAKAVAYGSENEKDVSFGYKGIMGRGLGWTHGMFKNGQRYSLEYPGTGVKQFIDRIYRDGAEIVPHSITPVKDNRTTVEKGLETFTQYNTRNWIDHGAAGGNDDFEDLASQGAIKGDEYYILDILAKFNYRYAWSYIDLKTDNYALNLLKPGDTAAIRPVLFYNNRLDDNLNDNKKIFLWSTLNTTKVVDWFYTPDHVDGLIKEKGVHIGHEYFGYTTCEKHAFYNNNGVIEIYPGFDEQLEYMAKKRADGLLWSPPLVELADYWTALKDVKMSYNQNGTITVSNNSTSALTGITLLAEKDIRSVIMDNYDLVSFGGSYGKRELVLPMILPGKSVVLRVNYGTKDSWFPTIVSNDRGKNKVNEITAYWSNAKQTLTMTAAARSGRHSFTVNVPAFANKTVTVTNINPKTMIIGNYKASSTGKFTFETDIKSIHTFELRALSPISPTLAIILPNGGENWPTGSRQMIRWTSTGIIGDIKIEYSTDKGGNWHTINNAAPNNGSYCWTAAQVLSSQCLIKISGAADGFPTDTSNNTFSIVHLPPQLSLNHTQLNFGANTSGVQTPSQTLLITNSGGNILDWSIENNLPWLKVTPSSGKNSGSVTAAVAISIEPRELSTGIYTGLLYVVAPNAANSPQKINITLTIYESGLKNLPIGSFDTPLQNAEIYGCVAFTGWALDNIGVESVKIYREAGQSLVYTGDAVFIPGVRPDVEKSYPNYPLNDHAGWGYMMLTNLLPDEGNGTFNIYAVATNKDGNAVTIGVKTIIAENAASVKPFGTIDTPEQGGTASGTGYRIGGWVLTPMPNMIPVDGSTINIYIDEVYVGHPAYNIYRSDVKALFPGYANSNGAYAYLDIDTTTYRNGIHQIYWIVTDNAGNVEGIGSRFFSIRN